MATAPQSVFDFGFMQWVTAAFLFLLFVTFLVRTSMAMRQKYYAVDRSKAGVVLLRFGLALMTASIFLSTPFIILLSLFASERLGLPYLMLPGYVPVAMLVVGIALVLVGEIVIGVRQRSARKKPGVAPSNAISVDTESAM